MYNIVNTVRIIISHDIIFYKLLKITVININKTNKIR